MAFRESFASFPLPDLYSGLTTLQSKLAAIGAQSDALSSQFPCNDAQFYLVQEQGIRDGRRKSTTYNSTFLGYVPISAFKQRMDSKEVSPPKTKAFNFYPLD